MLDAGISRSKYTMVASSDVSVGRRKIPIRLIRV